MPPPIFASSQPTKALVTLVLIENSQLLFPSWAALREHYLPTLLGTMRIANPVIPVCTTNPNNHRTHHPHRYPSSGSPPHPSATIPPPSARPRRDSTTSSQTSSSASAQITGSPRVSSTEQQRFALSCPVSAPLTLPSSCSKPPPNSKTALLAFIFSSSPPLRRSKAPGASLQRRQRRWATQSGVSSLSESPRYMPRYPFTRLIHLSRPARNTLPHDPPCLSRHVPHERLVQHGRMSHSLTHMSPLTSLKLQLQGRTQVAPWFPTSSEYTLLLSGDPASHTQPQSFPPLDNTAIDPIEKMLPTDSPQTSSLSVPRPPVLRHQSFPQDAPSPAQSGSTPSLVTSLQKVHGLSRKKLYGTQPPRQPFVREEPVRSKYKSTPTPLSIPVGSQHFSIPEDGRVGKAKVERGRRADRPTRIPDASSSCSPVRRGSWTYVPSDMGSSPSSPTTSLSSHATTSPTIPVYPDLAGYPTSPSTTTATFTPTVLPSIPIPETSFVSPLGDPSGGYFPLSPQFQTPPSTAIPVSPQTPVWAPNPKPGPMPMAKTPTANRRHSQEFAHGSHMQSLSAMSSKYRLDTLSAEPRATAKSTQKVKDAGDVPFIFSPELEAATAAKLKAALQSTTPVSAGATMSPYSAFGQVNYAALEECASDLVHFLNLFSCVNFFLVTRTMVIRYDRCLVPSARSWLRWRTRRAFAGVDERQCALRRCASSLRWKHVEFAARLGRLARLRRRVIRLRS